MISRKLLITVDKSGLSIVRVYFSANDPRKKGLAAVQRCIQVFPAARSIACARVNLDIVGAGCIIEGAALNSCSCT